MKAVLYEINLDDIVLQFKVDGRPLGAKKFGCGHINGTHFVTCDSGISYVVQRINSTVFASPEELMENISAVLHFISQKTTDRRAYLHLVPAKDGKMFFKSDDGEYWRVYEFVTHSLCLQKPETLRDFYNSGLAFGYFQRQLSDFPAKTLHEVIKDFHNTRARFAQLHQAIEGAAPEKKAACQKEIDFALEREDFAGIIVDGLADGSIPTRVTHNDTKLNNVLFDYDTRLPLCVIDLDTVMPGSALYDYGDAIRFGASSAAEDEKDLSRVWCDMELFRTYTEGFLDGCGNSLTEKEIDLMPAGAKMMTLECGTRFLADYLSGDVYFHTDYDGQNLDRARTQFKLVADMESKWETMTKIVAGIRR